MFLDKATGFVVALSLLVLIWEWTCSFQRPGRDGHSGAPPKIPNLHPAPDSVDTLRRQLVGGLPQLS